MSLMDVADPERVLREVARVLRPRGFVQFSVVHPATSTPIRRWVADESGGRAALAIGGYFYEGIFRYGHEDPNAGPLKSTTT